MCGVAGAFNVPNAAAVIRHLLHAQQNRGREACGILTIENGVKHHERFMGTVSDSFTEAVIERLPGTQGIGHVRYSTVKSEQAVRNVQPVELRYQGKPLAIAHNGNLTNQASLEQSILGDGLFKTDLDSELILHLIARASGCATMADKILNVLPHLRGSCSAVVIYPDELVAFCDGSGNRPLHWAQYRDGFIVASETSAFDAVGITLDQVHDVQPGQVVSFSALGVRTSQLPSSTIRRCSFELVYFAFPHSRIFGIQTEDIRRSLGQALAKEQPVAADVVIGIPDSAKLMAEGYAAASQIPLDQALIERRHNTGRTFIMPGQAKRAKAVEEKFSFSPRLKDKRVILIDDSIVRSTTSRLLTKALRRRGVRSVHWRIASPPNIAPCRYGINTPHRQNLIAAQMNGDVQRIGDAVGADSLAYLSLENFSRTIDEHGLPVDNTCYACMNNQYWDTET